jgi:hypothetical protein
MTDLLIHIGRHKTGTTAIQRFLSANAQWLRENGYYMPVTGFDRVAHRQIAHTISRHRPIIRAAMITPPVIADLCTEIRNESELSAVISSEAFQGRRPQLVRHYFSEFDPRVIVYIRNHLDYLASSYNQRVHATDYTGSIERYYATIYRVNYAKFLQNWDKHFPDKLTVRKFERKLLEQQDIVADFLRHGLRISASPEELDTFRGDQNPSLNARVTLFKLHLNRTGQTAQFPANKLYPALPRLNARFEAEKFRLPKKLRNKVVRKSSRSDKQAARLFFGDSTLFEYEDYRCASPGDLNNTDIQAMTEALLEEMALI